ncbi:hypothetical protein SAMD00019534_092000 [Acytostelium subglobosum LB1]|uniref:hypothetical protein n=1 Tax=Acytostelium subglobosum LB1 TaxID=1410327 RepID=UPI0006450994|nr:hypothetical protein SAMD00019534_092000 [Acytostelium subglobosum LB1]GAM26025.1 hypothetical protein SAMD00019534_092000 [Acytostelium subglobosum LB1]|eukprot:XP_012751068.1 hypothetical protein SAMD00019534_092000 [Acytostelium subglobosum LB1]
MTDNKLIKISVIGDNGVGKSSMILRYTENVFQYDNTKLDLFKAKMLDVNGKSIKLQVWNTCGQEKMAQLTSSYYRGMQGVIIAYDSTSKESFERMIQRWWPDAKRFAGQTTPIFVVGCKCDLDKQVSSEVLAAWCNQNKMVGFECSSRTGENIDEVFTLMTRKILATMTTAPVGGAPPVTTKDKDKSDKEKEKEKKKDNSGRNSIIKILSTLSSSSSSAYSNTSSMAMSSSNTAPLASSGPSGGSTTTTSGGQAASLSSSLSSTSSITSTSSTSSTSLQSSTGITTSPSGSDLSSSKSKKKKSGILDKTLRGSNVYTSPTQPAAPTTTASPIPPATQDQFMRTRMKILQIPIPTTPPQKVKPSTRMGAYPRPAPAPAGTSNAVAGGALPQATTPTLSASATSPALPATTSPTTTTSTSTQPITMTTMMTTTTTTGTTMITSTTNTAASNNNNNDAVNGSSTTTANNASGGGGSPMILGISLMKSSSPLVERKNPDVSSIASRSPKSSTPDSLEGFHEAYGYQAFACDDQQNWSKSMVEELIEERRSLINNNTKSTPNLLASNSSVPITYSSTQSEGSLATAPIPTFHISAQPHETTGTSPQDPMFPSRTPRRSNEFKYPDDADNIVGGPSVHNTNNSNNALDTQRVTLNITSTSTTSSPSSQHDDVPHIPNQRLLQPTPGMSLSSNAIFVAASNPAQDHSDTESIVGSIIGSSCGGGRESYNLDADELEEAIKHNSTNQGEAQAVQGKGNNNNNIDNNTNNNNNNNNNNNRGSANSGTGIESSGANNSNNNNNNQQDNFKTFCDIEDINPYDESNYSKSNGLATDSEQSATNHTGDNIDFDTTPVYTSDLNDRFQEVVLKFRDIPSLDTNLYNLQEISTDLLHISQDFIHTVKTYGRIIIEERFLQEKTIKHTSLGGHLGGDKYIVRNVLFKFAGGSPHGVYGEWGGAKVGGQELKGCMATLNCPINGLCVPLMALVDFMGYRLIAMSILPISSSSEHSTIVYGSSDMGQTVHASHEPSLDVMRHLAQALNLKAHMGGTQKPVKVYSATDIEGHIGTDGRYYLIDFSRTFPPTYPDLSVPGGHLFQLFRPEFLKNHPKPLCSDAFSGFLKHDSERQIHNNEVKEATQRLLNDLIPKVSSRLKGLIKESLENGDLLRGGVHIPEQFHRHGINMRFIGHMLVIVDEREAGFVLLIEAIARVLKNDLRRRLRETMKQFKEPLSAPYIQLTTNFLNMVFGESTTPNFKTEEFWEQTVATELYSKFYIYQVPNVVSGSKLPNEVPTQPGQHPKHPNAQQQGGMNSSTSGYPFMYNNATQTADGRKLSMILPPGWKLRDILEDRLTQISGSFVLGRHLLFTRFRDMTHLKFRKRTIEKVADTSQLLWNPYKPFNNSDLKKISVRVKARKRFELALISNPNNKETLQLCAQTWCKILEFSSSEGKNMSNVCFPMNVPAVVNTDRYFLRAIDANPKGPVILFFYARFLVRCDRIEKAETYFLRSLEEDPFNYRCLIAYANFLTERGFPNESSLFLNRAQECKNVIVGGLDR